MEVGVRDVILYQAGYETGVEGLRSLGVPAVEVAIDRHGGVRSLTGEETLNLSRPEELERFADGAREAGARVVALLCANDFNNEDRRAHLDWVVRAVRAAEALGCPAVRIDSIMTGQTELPLDRRIALYATAVRELLEATEGSPVALGIENHGPQGNDPEWMRGVLGAVDHGRLGVTLDVGNWYWYGHPLSQVYEIYREFGPRVKATHVKNIGYPEELRETQRPIGYEYGKYCCPLEEGDLRMAEVVRLLHAAGYIGSLTIEDESLGKYAAEERAGVLERDVRHLRDSIRAGISA